MDTAEIIAPNVMGMVKSNSKPLEICCGWRFIIKERKINKTTKLFPYRSSSGKGRTDESGDFVANTGGLLLKCPTQYEELESLTG